MVELGLGDFYGRELKNVKRVELKEEECFVPFTKVFLCTEGRAEVYYVLAFAEGECYTVLKIRDIPCSYPRRREYIQLHADDTLKIEGATISDKLKTILFPIKELTINLKDVSGIEFNSLRFLCETYEIGKVELSLSLYMSNYPLPTTGKITLIGDKKTIDKLNYILDEVQLADYEYKKEIYESKVGTRVFGRLAISKMIDNLLDKLK